MVLVTLRCVQIALAEDTIHNQERQKKVIALCVELASMVLL